MNAFISLLKLAWRWLARERRHGELTLIFVATLLAAAVAALTGRFTSHINDNLLAQGVELLGADLIIDSPDTLPQAWLAQAERSGLQVSPSVEFASVVMHADRLQLSSIKAASTNYPLRGEIEIADRVRGDSHPATGIPERGEVWVEPRLFDLLGLAIGDSIQLGRGSFTITASLAFEPSRGGSFFNLSPHILMRLDDLPATDLVQPGSRVHYRTGFSGPPPSIQTYTDWLQPRLREDQKLIDIHSGRPAMSRALGRIEQYLYLGSASALLLAGIAIAVTARRYADRHITSSALLRTYGVDSRRIVLLFLLQLILVGLLASPVGALLGWLGGQGLLYLINPAGTPPLFTLFDSNLLVALLTGLFTLLGFGVAPILAIRSVPAMLVLRRVQTPLSTSRWLGYLAAVAALFLLMWYQTGSLSLVVRFSLGALLLVVVAGVLFYLLMTLLRGIRIRGLWWRFGVANLWRQRRFATGQGIAFGLIFMCFALLVAVRQELFTQWDNQLPPGTPNHFAINIQPQQARPFAEALKRLNIDYDAIYPLVRGRLIELNGKPIRQAVSKEAEDHNALRRELNLTWSETLPYGNALVAGHWWKASPERRDVISVESRLAEQLGIQLGDTLTFLIGGDTFSAEVINLRSVEWESFRPNFYIIFPPGMLKEYPATYMTSFYLADSQRQVLPELLQQFPAVTLLDVDYLLSEVRRLFDQGSRAITAILSLILVSGAVLMVATVIASTDQRLQQNALLRALGASSRTLRQAQLAEFLSLGFMAGLLAWTGTELARYGLFSQVFDLPYLPSLSLLAGILIATMLALGITGVWATRRILTTSPVVLLRENVE